MVKVSLITFLFEFLIIFYLLFRFRFTILVKFFSVFLFFLGAYQFSEFALCEIGDFQFWGRFAFLSYNMLPAIALHFSLFYAYEKKKLLLFLIYFPTLIFALFAVFTSDFIFYTDCSTAFITIKTMFFSSVNDSFLLPMIYWQYYFLYIFFAVVVLLKNFRKEIIHSKKMVFLFSALAIVLTLVPSFILTIIIPSLGIVFPSLYCEFAVFFALIILVGSFFNSEFRKY